MQVMIDLYKRFDKAMFFLNAYYDVFSLYFTYESGH